MKKTFFLTLLIFFCTCRVQAQEMPETNKKIIDYVNTVIGKKVDYGECWDLAYRAVTKNNCAWDGKYKWGQRINPATDSIFPGDILQFYNATLKYKDGNKIYKEVFKLHTAIIFSIKGKGIYEIAHQNNAYSGRKVGLSELDLSNKVSGTIEFYRPVQKKLTDK
ncbi:MAG TPA: hypothetical protein PKL96_04170 [Bacteroidales bacterium]|nr:hypothetical protein [Bacteroidales bacterium]HPS26392.1 hypothetical protein [Bacteroidales bacterium]